MPLQQKHTIGLAIGRIADDRARHGGTVFQRLLGVAQEAGEEN
jgi:hypothetical protein